MGRGAKRGIELEGALWFHKDEQKFLGLDRIALLQKIDDLGSITKAAKAVGISYKNAWDLVNMVNNLAEKPLVERVTGGRGGGGTTLTAYGKEVVQQYGVLQEEHRRFLENLEGRLGDTASLYKLLRRISMKVSARNVLSGTITKITKGAVNAEVNLVLTGGAPLVAVITNGAVENLALKEGSSAYAIIKASSVMVGTDLHDAKISARNVMCGTVAKIVEGPVSTEIDVEVGGGNTISAVITHESGASLGLKVGAHACTLFKASSVILGVS
ncbi:TOBE domain-containing protein [Geomonas subterranea]|uniref:TOBE domain-containing protein n=1 Tax=Geomonas subterranea TaxID=2847989 RepID=A0ABX8LHU3_9BACT|nr:MULTISPECIES: TOBE domain-containing protein [Geomonas]QXE91611.1 TOBE domain-containing protein [Geomonas subterranea]QXM10298.1 TOBE domain-containing protein [Geomonas subterranea]